MSDKVPRTRAELERKLLDQLQYLERSADSYDEGIENEAIRMAVTLRILLHDKNKNKSLLGQLNKKSIPFFDTAKDNISNVKTAHYALVYISYGKTIAMLDDIPNKMTCFDSWWTDTIFIDDKGSGMSRKNIILTMAEQDGGAHVDPNINRDYSELSTGQSLGYVYSNNGSNWLHVHGAELTSVRQMAHEILKTLKPDYAKKPNLPDEIIISSGIQIECVKEQNETSKTSNGASGKIGRNDPCFCGSGKKYKKCCGADQDV